MHLFYIQPFCLFLSLRIEILALKILLYPQIKQSIHCYPNLSLVQRQKGSYLYAHHIMGGEVEEEMKQFMEQIFLVSLQLERGSM